MFRTRIISLVSILALGFSVDRTVGTGLVLVPVGATGSHVINGDEIRVPSGGTTVVLEIRVFGWDAGHNNDPLLKAYQAQIQSAGYTSGSSGFLTAGYAPCTSNNDCPNGWVCGARNACDAVTNAFIDQNHPNYAYFGLQDIAAVDRSQPNYRFGAVVLEETDSIPDVGTAKYGGTLRLVVSPDATGTFTVGFRPDESFWLTQNDLAFAMDQLLPARITISTNDCNVNGVLDEQDIASGTSADCNDNGVPDECEADCNNNDRADECDLALGCSNDCNENTIPDDCEADCNRNRIADECDIAGGSSTDCDHDGIPDECQAGSESDCNNNGTPDRCDIAVGTSDDCNSNDVPDECELSGGGDCNGNSIPDSCESDCNSNGVADACDISSGTSTDANGDGVPDECFTHIAWVPVEASTGHYITGNNILIPAGGSRVTLQAFFSGWDLDRDGNPLLHLYQFTFDSAGLTSGSSGSLASAAIACANNNDCFGQSTCNSGVCDGYAAAFIDDARPDFLFSGLNAIVAADVSQPNYRWGSVITSGVFVGVPDAGRAGYAGSLILDASQDALGTFTIGFLMGPSDSFYGGPDNDPILPMNAGVPATITIVDDCNNNGVSDRTDLTAGTSQDCNGNGFPDQCDLVLADDPDCNGNGQLDECESLADCNGNGRGDVCDLASGNSNDDNSNGIPDECETAAPAVAAQGGRYLEVTPAPGPGTVALRVVSPDYPCLIRYIEMVNGVGRLSMAPVFRTPAQWGLVRVGDSEVTPDATYDVYVDHDNGLVSPPARTITGLWGDVVLPKGVSFTDVAALVDGFRGLPCSVAVEVGDLHPAVPNHKVDFGDIAAGVDAFRSLPYPYGQPCP